MAKQRGPHQLSGKINNLCYYEQKGVRGGLVRRINDGMSERLRIGEEFENTRSANSVFGMCSMLAAQIFNVFSSREIFLFRADRQAVLTKILFKLYRKYHVLGSGDTLDDFIAVSAILPELFNAVVKNKFTDYFNPIMSSYTAHYNVYTFFFRLTGAEIMNVCLANGWIGMQISYIGSYAITPPSYDSVTKKYIASDVLFDVTRPTTYNWYVGESFNFNAHNTLVYKERYNFQFLVLRPIIRKIGDRPICLDSRAICQMMMVYYAAE